jgi:hypothetical protein
MTEKVQLALIAFIMLSFFSWLSASSSCFSNNNNSVITN